MKVSPLAIGPVVVDPPVLQAPMAGFTNYAYRQMARQLGGAGLLATEMVSARGFLGIHARSERFPDRLWGVHDEPRPLAVQIWDNDPGTLAAVGARLAHEFGVSVVDINFGCPAADVSLKSKSGAYLLGDPAQIGRIVARVVAACRPVPVTAKIRLGLSRDTVNAADVAQAVEGAGGAALTVHGRTAADWFRGQADWASIAALRPFVAIPLVGNGDLASADDVLEAFRRWPVDGVMIGRAAVKRPWIFSQVAAALRGEPVPADPTPLAERELLMHHFRLVIERFGDQKGTVLMRRLACSYAQGRPGARTFRANISQVNGPAEFTAVLLRDFPLNGAA